ncbi:MAG: hypothetical protein R2788_01605 [Saprospiraceae bacterium]
MAPCPMPYQWATGENTAELSGIGSGIYNVTLTDANGCQEAGGLKFGKHNGTD